MTGRIEVVENKMKTQKPKVDVFRQRIVYTDELAADETAREYLFKVDAKIEQRQYLPVEEYEIVMDIVGIVQWLDRHVRLDGHTSADIYDIDADGWQVVRNSDQGFYPLDELVEAARPTETGREVKDIRFPLYLGGIRTKNDRVANQIEMMLQDKGYAVEKKY